MLFKKLIHFGFVGLKGTLDTKCNFCKQMVKTVVI